MRVGNCRQISALQSETEIDTKKICRRFRTFPNVRRTLMMPGNQRLGLQVVVPYYTKNSIFGPVFGSFFPSDPKITPRTAPYGKK